MSRFLLTACLFAAAISFSAAIPRPDSAISDDICSPSTLADLASVFAPKNEDGVTIIKTLGAPKPTRPDQPQQFTSGPTGGPHDSIDIIRKCLGEAVNDVSKLGDARVKYDHYNHERGVTNLDVYGQSGILLTFNNVGWIAKALLNYLCLPKSKASNLKFQVKNWENDVIMSGTVQWKALDGISALTGAAVDSS